MEETFEDALRRVAAENPLASIVPVREAAYAISAMFLGIELMSRLDPERSEAEAVFGMMEAIAQVVGSLDPTTLVAGLPTLHQG